MNARDLLGHQWLLHLRRDDDDSTFAEPINLRCPDAKICLAEDYEQATARSSWLHALSFPSR